jgi:hypothetical protein
MKRFALIAICGSTLACASAGADVVTETGSLSIDTTTGGSSDTLSFAQFNSALGTLTGISVELMGTANSVYSVATNSTTPFTTTGTSSTTLTLSGAGLNSLSTPTLTASVTGGSVNASPSSSTFVETYFPGSPSEFDLLGTVASGSLGAYIGSGSASVLAQFSNFTSSGTSTNPAGSFAGAGGGGQASGDLTVTFDYTPVPLPPALPLLLSGFAALGLLAKRRRGAAVA